MNSINVHFSKNPTLKWIPASLMMLAIFLFSAHPSINEHSDWFDPIVNKGGHVIGYALLALSYWRMFYFKDNKRWIVWLLAVLYAVTDEYHQSFVPGRHPSALDVLVFDNFGALISLWLAGTFTKQGQPAPESLVVEHEALNANS
jgi:VanZ family protein